MSERDRRGAPSRRLAPARPGMAEETSRPGERFRDRKASRQQPTSRSIAREPLLHFLAIGAALFGLYVLVDRSRVAEARRVVVTPGRVEQMRQTFAAQWRRPPTREELDGLIRSHVREEILYREALRLGLDRDDTIVRRRLAQKMEFLNEEAVDVAAPTEDALAGFFAARPDRYRVPETVSFAHVYFSADQRGEAGAEKAARDLLAALAVRPPASEEIAGLGDPLLLESEHERLAPADVDRLFGDDFARAVFALEPGTWRGPVRSSYGIHLVRVSDRRTGRTPALDEVRDEVETDWRHARREAADARLIEALGERYEVVIEGENETGRGSEGAHESETSRPRQAGSAGQAGRASETGSGSEGALR